MNIINKQVKDDDIMKIELNNAKVELIEKKYLASDNVAKLCIRKGWYTKGDNVAYSKLLSYIEGLWGKNITDAVIKKISLDIYNHSNIEELCGVYGCEPISYLINIIDNIVNLIEIIYEFK